MIGKSCQSIAIGDQAWGPELPGDPEVRHRMCQRNWRAAGLPDLGGDRRCRGRAGHRGWIAAGNPAALPYSAGMTTFRISSADPSPVAGTAARFARRMTGLSALRSAAAPLSAGGVSVPQPMPTSSIDPAKVTETGRPILPTPESRTLPLMRMKGQCFVVCGSRGEVGARWRAVDDHRLAPAAFNPLPGR